MGYSEVCCSICGVSFNIARIRTPEEPESAAWNGYGPFGCTYVCNLSYQVEACKKNGGCQVLKLDRKMGELPARLAHVEDDWMGDDDRDATWMPVDSEDDEPYEYATPRESDDGDGAEDDAELLTADAAPDDTPESETASEILYRRFHQPPTLSVLEEVRLGETSDLRPVSAVPRYSAHMDDPDRLDAQEHIAGPHCAHPGGYSGHRISVEEMDGCSRVQCLVPKDDSWRPEPDDQDFELRGRCFLSGISDHMPSRDYGRPLVFPARHLCGEPCADTNIWDEQRAAETAMPFHPACLEVFRRASLHRRLRLGGSTAAAADDGAVESSLADWFALAAPRWACGFDRHPAVQRASTQEWTHAPGDEFLAANPCFVPALRKVLAAAAAGAHGTAAAAAAAEPDYHRGAFDVPASSGPPRGDPSGDPFSRLPNELAAGILSQLGSRDTANLRLASRRFRQLAQSAFHSLLLREAPWLWEAWCGMDYAFWAGTSAHALREADKQWRSEKQDIEGAIQVLLEEGLPHDENQEAVAALRARIARHEVDALGARKNIAAPQLPAATTDWHRLCLDVKRNWARLGGLQNRRRIWADCEGILDEIERLRREGRMGAGVVVDVLAETRAAWRQRLRERRAGERYRAAGSPGEFRVEDWDTEE